MATSNTISIFTVPRVPNFARLGTPKDVYKRQTSTRDGSITSVQAVYVPADDLTDPAPATTFAHLDATTVLSRKIVEQEMCIRDRYCLNICVCNLFCLPQNCKALCTQHQLITLHFGFADHMQHAGTVFQLQGQFCFLAGGVHRADQLAALPGKRAVAALCLGGKPHMERRIGIQIPVAVAEVQHPLHGMPQMCIRDSSLTSARRIRAVLEEQPALATPADPVAAVADGSIDFADVSFKYSAAAARDALSHVTLHIPAGATVGIIGGTGAAKTTLVQLIPRLYDATSGTVKVGGQDVRRYYLCLLYTSRCV